MITRKLAATFTLSAVAAGLIAAATPALASVTYTYPASMCNSRDVYGNNGAATELNSWGQADNISSSSIYLYCPIIANGQAIQNASINFWSNGSDTMNGASISAELCTTYVGGGGGMCQGSPYNNANTWVSGSGVYSLGINTDSYVTGGYNYLDIGLSGKTATSQNTFFGYAITLAN